MTKIQKGTKLQNIKYGSEGIVVKRAKNISNASIVKIQTAWSHHKKGDQHIWEDHEVGVV